MGTIFNGVCFLALKKKIPERVSFERSHKNGLVRKGINSLNSVEVGDVIYATCHSLSPCFIVLIIFREERKLWGGSFLTLSVILPLLSQWGTPWRIWLRHCAINWKVTGSFPDGVIWNFQWSLWSSGQSFCLQIQRSRVRFPALPDFSE